MPAHAEAGPAGRLPLRTSADTYDEVRRVLGKLEASGRVNTISQLLANSPNGFRPYILMSDALNRKAALPARTRELIILYLAARSKVEYEWSEHVPMSAAAGVTEAERDALSKGRLDALPALADDEHAALLAADELTSSGVLSPSTWDDLVRRLGTEASLDVALTVAWWGHWVPVMIGAVGLR